MTTANRIVHFVLVLLIATICKKYFQLQGKYEELRVTCEASCQGSLDQSTAQRNGKSKQIQIHSNTAIVFMQSSTKEDIVDMSENTAGGDGFANEPTFDDNIGEQYVTFTSPGQIVNNVAGIVHQTSHILHVKQKPGTDPTHDNQKHVTHMDSTEDFAVNPSQNNFDRLDLTEKHSLQESLSEGQKQNLSQIHDVHLIHPSETTIVHKSLDHKDENPYQTKDLSKVGNVENNDDKTYTSSDTNINEHNLSSIQDPVEFVSSDSTKEKNIFVLQTSLEESVNGNPNDMYNYLDTDESTPLIDTNLHGDFFHLMTDSAGYTQDDIYEIGEDSVQINVNKAEKKTQRLNGAVKETTPDYITIPNDDERHQFIRHGTSARCQRGDQNSCLFHNICYNTREKDFVFFKGEKSVVEKDELNEEDPDNVFDIDLSTIHGHSAGMFPIVTLPASLVNDFSFGIVNKKSIAINRFKPDNIMHVLHDDVLPLFQTLDSFRYPLLGNRFDVAIVFTDKYDNGNYLDLYSSLSTVDLLSPWQLNKTYDLLCFPSLHIGLETSTIWYQYGFFQPQGPVTPLKQNILENIHKATDNLSLHFKSDCFLCSQGNYLVLLSRKDNRLILNEGELIMSITKSTRLKIMSVSLETHSLSDIISTIRQSRGVIGMHGSLLSLIVFLPPGSVVIELFPFAVNPSHYTPFKTFCDLPGSTLVYKSWANPSLTDSVPHPGRPASEGGIRHLPKSLQSEIVSQTDVPKHLCCDNPSWLYHIYQDTIVYINGVVALVLNAIHEAENAQVPSHQFLSAPLSRDIPGSVRNLQCKTVDATVADESHMSFVVSWDVPWVFNYDAKASKDFKYEIVIQKDGDEFDVRRLELSTHDNTSHRFKSTTKELGVAYNVWVRVIGIRESKGQSKFVNCS